ncbi:hypothetical protein FACS1894137_09300 [Spirochaetia bacterium]|nr:hypothetical protein FACS1894137_09300 [Spirochaetia bacterium]
MRKKIKINFEGFWPEFDYHWLLPYKILLKHFDVNISDNPDYLFCGIYKSWKYCMFKGIRIGLITEIYSADFNLFDYSFVFEDMRLGDRTLYFPGFMTVHEFELLQKRKFYTQEDIISKTKFCNMVNSHGGRIYLNGKPAREELFNIISEYKHVDSAGKYLNNMNGFTPGDGLEHYTFNNKSKLDFQKNYKFSIVSEPELFPYCLTEKITNAFAAGTIPIFCGDQSVLKFFNPKSFINYYSYPSDKEFVEHIKEIDNNDELFLEMLNQNIFNDPQFIHNTITGIEKFLLNIFNQDYEAAFRRPRYFFIEDYEKKLILISKITENKLFIFFIRIKNKCRSIINRFKSILQ